LRYIAVDDAGTILNHYLADAQVHGAIAQGIGQALYEETIYSPDGQLLSSTLMDYTMPIAEQIPSLLTAFVETPSPINPLGAKGVGEGGTTGAPPAIVNAAIDALAPLGIRHLDMPLKPEKIWASIVSAQSGTPPEAKPEPPAIFHTQQANQEDATSTFA
jgi:carbon-monoxide dehydrogenase large subunit